jgi:hypothetical protein
MHTLKVLVVDDDTVDRTRYVRLLAKGPAAGCTVHQAASGTKGLQMLGHNRYDCVLLDLRLPDMTGLEFLEQAARDGEQPCAILLITGQGDEATAVAAMKLGVQDYLLKDRLDANRLWLALSQAVGRVQLRQRLAQNMRDLQAANQALEAEVAARTAAQADLQAAKELAEQANQAKTRFVAMVTHELRTPLNGILGYAQLLRIETKLPPRQDAQVGAIIEAGRSLLALIERVLDFAGLEIGRIDIRPEQLDVPALIAACAAAVQPLAVQRGLRLRAVHMPDAPTAFAADPARLRQVVLNLLGNAVKYTDTGWVELRALQGAAQGALRIEVADTGRGIDPDSQTRLFKEFERVDGVSSQEGAGLGLAISLRIVHQMGGTIGYAPHPPQGSLFWFEIPCADLSADQPAPSRTVPARILLVDDIDINLEIIGSYIAAAGHKVTTASTGQDAVRIAGKDRFDLVLMDLRLPDIDGLEATRRIRGLPAPFGTVPVLALTAYLAVAPIDACIGAGLDGLLPKPLDHTMLIRAIEDALGIAAPRPDTPGATSLAAAQPTEAARRAAQSILLVDDIEINVDIIASFLKMAGWTVATARNGHEAIRAAAQQPFALVLMDIRMPVMDGIEAARRIRALPPPNGTMPILALTAHVSLQQAGTCLEAGMDGNLPKPIDYETLVHAVEAAIAHGHQPPAAQTPSA